MPARQFRKKKPGHGFADHSCDIDLEFGAYLKFFEGKAKRFLQRRMHHFSGLMIFWKSQCRKVNQPKLEHWDGHTTE